MRQLRVVICHVWSFWCLATPTSTLEMGKCYRRARRLCCLRLRQRWLQRMQPCLHVALLWGLTANVVLCPVLCCVDESWGVAALCRLFLFLYKGHILFCALLQEWRCSYSQGSWEGSIFLFRVSGVSQRRRQCSRQVSAVGVHGDCAACDRDDADFDFCCISVFRDCIFWFFLSSNFSVNSFVFVISVSMALQLNTTSI